MFDFAANKEVADLTNVPKNMHAFYEPKDPEDDSQGYQLCQNNPVVSTAVGIITGQQTALQKERKAKAANAVDLSPLSEYGTDPAAIAEAFNQKTTQLEAQIKDSGAVKTQIEDMKREMTTAHAAALKAEQDKNQNLTSQLDDYMVNTQIATAATAFPGLDPTLVAPFVRKHLQVDVDQSTQKRTVQVLDKDGSPRYSMDRPGELAGVGELLADMSKSDKYARLFPSQHRSGADTKPNDGVRRPSRKDADLSPAARISRGLANRS